VATSTSRIRVGRESRLCHTAAVAVAQTGRRRALVSACALFAAVLCALAGPVASTASAASTKSSGATKPLVAPKSTYAQDAKYLTDVTLADPALASYEQKRGNVALRALLTDGSAFCALVKRGGGIDEALVAEATGARSAESQSHLPLSVTTFNSIEAVALLRLCPTEQKLVPASVRTKIRSLGNALAKHSG
jgi:hypothetical protein